MSKKATTAFRTVAKALSTSNKAAEDARLAADASRLAKDAVSAAVAAACAARRATAPESADTPASATNVRKVTQDARAAAEEAVEHARNAMRAEDLRDAVGAVWSASLSAKAAQRAGSLASAAAVAAGTAREMASARTDGEPTLTVVKERAESPRELSAAIERSARYLVTYDARIIATFAREEDAFLLESELADLDRARGVTSGRCEVLDRKSGHRLGGYLMAGSKMLVFVRDEQWEAHYGKGRR